jgi:hypothetical protein
MAISGELLVVAVNGYGKRVRADSIPRHNRDSMGVRISPHPVAGTVMLDPEDREVLLASRSGKIIALAVDQIPILGRTARGVRLMRLGAGDQVVRVAKVPSDPAESHGDAPYGPELASTDEPGPQPSPTHPTRQNAPRAPSASDQPRVDALWAERQELNALMEADPAERTYAHFERRDQIDKRLDRLAPKHYPTGWEASDLSAYVMHVQHYGPDAVMESAFEDLSERDLGKLKATIESMERTHQFKAGKWIERRQVIRQCERCGLDLPPGYRGRFHRALQRGQATSPAAEQHRLDDEAARRYGDLVTIPPGSVGSAPSR